MDKLPPIEKIYEAYSAIADGRVSMSDHKDSAIVKSSSGAKEYTVTWRRNMYVSSDSASYWQGYSGYPVLAILMLREMLPLDWDIAALFVCINWTLLNKKHKRDYDSAVDEVMHERNYDAKPVEKVVYKVYEKLRHLIL